MIKPTIAAMINVVINLKSNQFAALRCQQQSQKSVEQLDEKPRVSRRRAALRRVGLIHPAVMAWVAGLAIATHSFLSPLPAMASANFVASGSDGLVAMPAMAMLSTVASLSGKAKAAAKDTEGKLESAYGDLSGDQGRQIKGAAKQVQGSAMNAGEDIKEGIQSVAK
jgi:uncharacterized protein YjbJ (UPF0337 family)